MRRFGWLAFSVLLFGVVGCDHATKHVAEAALAARAPLQLVPGVLDLSYAPNTDTAFSLLGHLMLPGARLVLLLVVSTLATLAVTALVVRRWKHSSRLERVAGALLLGGAIGNVADRAWRGQVIDFIHVEHWPVFNVADVAICVGVALLAIAWRTAEHATHA